MWSNCYRNREIDKCQVGRVYKHEVIDSNLNNGCHVPHGIIKAMRFSTSQIPNKIGTSLNQLTSSSSAKNKIVIEIIIRVH